MYCIPDVHIAICVKGKNNTYISGRQFYIRVKKGIDVDIHGERAQSLIMVVHNCFYGFELKSSYLKTCIVKSVTPTGKLGVNRSHLQTPPPPNLASWDNVEPSSLYVIGLRTRQSSFPRPFSGRVPNPLRRRTRYLVRLEPAILSLVFVVFFHFPDFSDFSRFSHFDWSTERNTHKLRRLKGTYTKGGYI